MTPPPPAHDAAAIAEIAKRLTKAQVTSLLHGKCGLPRLNDEWSSDCICAASECDSLRGIRLAVQRDRYPGGVVLTPLGLAVRASLAQSKGEE